ncbi:Hsp20/alpha crystallin family protein [Sulfurovum sp. NBC37-1]|uniref:Hsp20/alpha crystallin family protein n=1 Tax=Sulfurovum sp. (strain NBC37-1) TaxID=387093 RepID=UPI00015877AD|nr:Hsp20/alpha crystallin family protein [Sulfurovum sp. NBC37-1]BAF71338.1 heat shock protein Hsp20 [Sulfurovum sp. NBC37-1]
MLVTKYNPYNEVKKSFDLFNSLVQNFDVAREEGAIASFVPRVNTREGEDAYHVEIDLPGIKKEDIEITTEDNVLTISGERKMKDEVKEEDYYKVESAYGKFSRSFTLPEKVDIENIHAESKDGVLEVVIPKLKEEEKKPKKIEIK